MQEPGPAPMPDPGVADDTYNIFDGPLAEGIEIHEPYQVEFAPESPVHKIKYIMNYLDYS